MSEQKKDEPIEFSFGDGWKMRLMLKGTSAGDRTFDPLGCAGAEHIVAALKANPAAREAVVFGLYDGRGPVPALEAALSAAKAELDKTRAQGRIVAEIWQRMGRNARAGFDDNELIHADDCASLLLASPPPLAQPEGPASFHPGDYGKSALLAMAHEWENKVREFANNESEFETQDIRAANARQEQSEREAARLRNAIVEDWRMANEALAAANPETVLALVEALRTAVPLRGWALMHVRTNEQANKMLDAFDAAMAKVEAMVTGASER